MAFFLMDWRMKLRYSLTAPMVRKVFENWQIAAGISQGKPTYKTAQTYANLG
ncbi:MAG TPA: hypothetical protein VKL99_03820 [Candidatus Angelobacter sp.]|nr:hypothetical protein [Candidatus Angelobacter sp.]